MGPKGLCRRLSSLTNEADRPCLYRDERSPERRSHSCTNMEAMFRAMVMKALEGYVVAFREVMELVSEFGLGMQSQLAARKLSLELQSHLLESRKR